MLACNKKAPLSGAFLLSLLLCSAVAPLYASQCQAPADVHEARVETVVDGDTLHLRDGRKVRLIGLDTPEIGHRGTADGVGAQAARRALLQMIEQSGGRVYLKPGNQSKDRYGRLLAHVFNAKRENLTWRLLREGKGYQIAVPPNLGFLDCYLEGEAEARKAGLGLWRVGPVDVQRLQGDETGFHLLQGLVIRVNTSRSGLWLNLQGGVALRITWVDWRNFELADPQALKGRRLEVRGWLYRSEEMQRMRLRHPSAIHWL